MLYGRTPFRGKNRQKTFANILNKDLTFPSSVPVKSYVADTYMLAFFSLAIFKTFNQYGDLHFVSIATAPAFTTEEFDVMVLQVSLAGRQLMNALLNRDPGSRLGSNGGANEIKQHPFFRGIKWPLIRCMVPTMHTFNLNIKCSI